MEGSNGLSQGYWGEKAVGVSQGCFGAAERAPEQHLAGSDVLKQKDRSRSHGSLGHLGPCDSSSEEDCHWLEAATWFGGLWCENGENENLQTTRVAA